MRPVLAGEIEIEVHLAGIGQCSIFQITAPQVFKQPRDRTTCGTRTRKSMSVANRDWDRQETAIPPSSGGGPANTCHRLDDFQGRPSVHPATTNLVEQDPHGRC
jgi:hypothetical protein